MRWSGHDTVQAINCNDHAWVHDHAWLRALQTVHVLFVPQVNR